MTQEEFFTVVRAVVNEGREEAVRAAEEVFPFSDKAAERFADEVGDFCRKHGVRE